MVIPMIGIPLPPGDDWRETHNYVHHTYTNIVGKDHDVGWWHFASKRSTEVEPRHLI